MPKRKAPSSPLPKKGANVANHGADTVPTSATYNKPGSSASGEVTKLNTSPDTGTSSHSSAGTGEDPPPYGSQEYWEKRYSVLKPPGHRGQFELDGTQDDVEVNALPGHAWYFSYDELRPLLLPLLLGRDVSPAAFLTGGEDDDGEYEGAEEEQVNDGDMYDGGKDGRENGQEDYKDEEAETKTTCIIGTTSHESEQDKNEEGERHGSAPCGDETIGKNQPPHPPKSVLEIGCGDVPLGYSLFLDLLSMEKETQADASFVVSRIVCNDYAKMVVDILRGRQRKRWQAYGIKGSYEIADGRDGMKIENVVVDSDSLNPLQEHDASSRGTIVPKLDVSYVVEDARKMAHKDESFDLIIDKGTLDALLSDKDMGIKNCVDVVSEMARVLRVGGYIMIVSHMNANIQSGLEWCDEVVVAGLRASGAEAWWEIEIHGNDGNEEDSVDDDDDDDDDDGDDDADDDSDEDGEENTDEDGEAASNEINAQRAEHYGKEEEDADIGTADKGPPSGSPGPACYIIHKFLPQQPTADGQMMIPLKFFTY